eukprot:scaffold46572_cov60-Phaeocystis_antarctica.AAC.2
MVLTHAVLYARDEPSTQRAPQHHRRHRKRVWNELIELVERCASNGCLTQDQCALDCNSEFSHHDAKLTFDDVHFATFKDVQQRWKPNFTATTTIVEGLPENIESSQLERSAHLSQLPRYLDLHSRVTDGCDDEGSPCRQFPRSLGFERLLLTTTQSHLLHILCDS